MHIFLQRVALIVLFFATAGCSSAGDTGDSGNWFGGDSTLHTVAAHKPTADITKPAGRYAAILRVSRYADQRELRNPRLLGTSTQLVREMSGSQLLLDQEIADLVTSAIKMQFGSEGFEVLEDGDVGNAVFEVSGTIKDLALNVKYRDEINIAIATTVKDLRSGAVAWSGSVTEKNDRFAGVSGNSRDDVVDYLNKELRVVTSKTVAAISASLMAAHPALFNLTEGTRAIPGVSVYVAPVAAGTASAVVDAASGVQPGSTAILPEKMPTNTGLLLLSTSPPRAKVYLDGVYYGLSPLRVDMEAGIHAVAVKLKGYKAVTEKVSVRKGDKTEMELSLER